MAIVLSPVDEDPPAPAHPRNVGRYLVPVTPALVCEVAYEHIDRGRLRHPARFRRWREDRDPRSATFAQLEPAEAGRRLRRSG